MTCEAVRIVLIEGSLAEIDAVADHALTCPGCRPLYDDAIAAHTDLEDLMRDFGDDAPFEAAWNNALRDTSPRWIRPVAFSAGIAALAAVVALALRPAPPPTDVPVVLIGPAPVEEPAPAPAPGPDVRGTATGPVTRPAPRPAPVFIHGSKVERIDAPGQPPHADPDHRLLKYFTSGGDGAQPAPPPTATGRLATDHDGTITLGFGGKAVSIRLSRDPATAAEELYTYATDPSGAPAGVTVAMATEALSRADAFEPAVRAQRVVALHAARTRAARSLWQDTPSNAELRADTARFAQEWLAAARAAGQDPAEARTVCLETASDATACDATTATSGLRKVGMVACTNDDCGDPWSRPIAHVPGPADCDPARLEAAALLGRLEPWDVACLEAVVTSAAPWPDRDRASRVLMAHAWVGDRPGWLALAERHLALDDSDPDLAYKVALDLSKQDRPEDVIRWADVALSRSDAWKQETRVERSYNCHKLRSAAAYEAWNAAEVDRDAAPGPVADVVVEEARARTAAYAAEWAAFARASGKDPTKAITLCISAAGADDLASCGDLP